MRILVNAECINVPEDVKIDETDEDWTFAVFPAKFEVCGNCNGKGSHVNRAIDGNGLSDELSSDPDFCEDYLSGVYDVRCDVCGGQRVVLVPASEAGEQAVQQVMQQHYASEAEVAAERRMGA